MAYWTHDNTTCCNRLQQQTRPHPSIRLHRHHHTPSNFLRLHDKNLSTNHTPIASIFHTNQQQPNQNTRHKRYFHHSPINVRIPSAHSLLPYVPLSLLYVANFAVRNRQRTFTRHTQQRISRSPPPTDKLDRVTINTLKKKEVPHALTVRARVLNYVATSPAENTSSFHMRFSHVLLY